MTGAIGLSDRLRVSRPPRNHASQSVPRNQTQTLSTDMIVLGPIKDSVTILHCVSA